MSFEDAESPASGDRFETHPTALSGQQIPSRRALREAERARTEAVAVDPFVEIAKVSSTAPSPVDAAAPTVANPELNALFGTQPPTVVRESTTLSAAEVVGSRSRNSKKSGRAPSKSFAKLARAKGNETAPRKLRRAEVRLVRATNAPKSQRKNPLSVLATMLAVGGMVAVVGLPAYANLLTETPGTAAAKTDAASQDLIVPAALTAATAIRDGYSATTPEQLAQMSRDALRAAENQAYLLSGARELGDDYPWPYELPDDMGGGLSPLNYYYRECVDFVAWRLNRDQGSYSAPFKWVWSNLTPTGGNASQWLYAWESKGRTVSATPIVGSVAWFPGANHVAYVKAVLDGGYVLIEEYNHGSSHMYGQRVIPVGAATYLYPPS